MAKVQTLLRSSILSNSQLQVSNFWSGHQFSFTPFGDVSEIEE